MAASPTPLFAYMVAAIALTKSWNSPSIFSTGFVGWCKNSSGYVTIFKLDTLEPLIFPAVPNYTNSYVLNLFSGIL